MPDALLYKPFLLIDMTVCSTWANQQQNTEICCACMTEKRNRNLSERALIFKVRKTASIIILPHPHLLPSLLKPLAQAASAPSLEVFADSYTHLCLCCENHTTSTERKTEVTLLEQGF